MATLEDLFIAFCKTGYLSVVKNNAGEITYASITIVFENYLVQKFNFSRRPDMSDIEPIIRTLVKYLNGTSEQVQLLTKSEVNHLFYNKQGFGCILSGFKPNLKLPNANEPKHKLRYLKRIRAYVHYDKEKLPLEVRLLEDSMGTGVCLN